MKMNLKKAISAVIAFAVAGSMIPASFAAKITLTDVAETAPYATAVNTLVALDVINGYEDGTFLPDNLITRAEATKIVVATLNKIDVAEGMKGSTIFTDVEAKHEWATGFINAGVAEGFINGMGDGTFAPDANVTYAQIVTMLVRILGYEEYAQYMGGWPNGYLSIGNSEGVTKGVSANANDPATRAQVAMLAYNALTTPIVANTGMVYSASAGGFVPNIEKQDGTNDAYYKTLLTENFDAYFVEGYVTETSKSGGTLKADEINFLVAKGEKYDNTDFTKDDKAVKASSYDDAKTKNVLLGNVKVGDTDAADYAGAYAQAIIREDEYGDYVLVSFIPSGKNKTVEFDADLIDEDDLKEVADGYKLEDKDGATIYYLEYFASDSAAKSTKYNLQKNDSKELAVSVYVNGVQVADGDHDTEAKIKEAIETYVVNNNVGKIQLVDTYKTDGYYDTIYANYYATAKVSSVNTATGRVSLQDITGAKGVSITLDDEDEDLTYHIYNNGTEVALSSLKVDDIISIAYDVTVSSGNVGDSKFYEIYVSNDTVTEKLTGKNDADKELKFNGVAYQLVKKYADEEADYTLGDEYVLYLDAFGRIFDKETAESSDRYAIIDRYVNSTSEDEYRATIYTTEGVQRTYTVDAAKVTLVIDGTTTKGSASTKPTIRQKIKDAVYVSSGVKQEVEKRVIKYKVSSSSGYITTLEFLKPTRNETGDKLTFNARTNALGSIKLDNSTKVFDAIEYTANGYDKYSDLAIASVDSFNDDKSYVAFAYGDRKNTGIDPIVLVKEGAQAYDENTRFAVVANAPGKSTDENGDEVYTIPAYYKAVTAESDDPIDLIANDDVPESVIFGSGSKKGLQTGDVIVFDTDSNGYIKELFVISNWGDDITDYNTIVDKTIADYTQYVNLSSELKAKSDKWSDNWADVKNEEVTIIYGPIVGRSSKNLSVGQINSEKTDQNSSDVVDIGLTSDTNIYIYDYSLGTKSRLSPTTSIPFTSFDKTKVKDDVIDWSGTDNPVKEQANFAFVLVADGEALDVLVLAAK